MMRTMADLMMRNDTASWQRSSRRSAPLAMMLAVGIVVSVMAIIIQHSGQVWGVLGARLLVTALLGTCVVMMVGRTAQVERLVAARRSPRDAGGSDQP